MIKYKIQKIKKQRYVLISDTLLLLLFSFMDGWDPEDGSVLDRLFNLGKCGGSGSRAVSPGPVFF